ncbi:GIY-YIG nuclease family protein [Streptomyces sp. NPDC060198]|uniref:GIY-YIG nuclease family protein n=1 Tax=Streptomyces sp. NPDC060198 TaxID=3347070 RepID=UPI00365C7AFF
MYEEHRGHLWGPDTQAAPLAEQLALAGALIDPHDPALTEILLELGRIGGELRNLAAPDDDTVRMAIRLGRARHERLSNQVPAPRRKSARENPNGSIYYVRRGAMVKIGTTINLQARMAALLPEEILAIEPGSHAKEAELHRQFRSLLVPGQREWFYAGPELQEHIEKVLDAQGPPPANLPTLPPTTGILDS